MLWSWYAVVLRISQRNVQILAQLIILGVDGVVLEAPSLARKQEQEKRQRDDLTTSC